MTPLQARKCIYLGLALLAGLDVKLSRGMYRWRDGELLLSTQNRRGQPGGWRPGVSRLDIVYGEFKDAPDATLKEAENFLRMKGLHP